MWLFTSAAIRIIGAIFGSVRHSERIISLIRTLLGTACGRTDAALLSGRIARVGGVRRRPSSVMRATIQAPSSSWRQPSPT